MADAAREQHKKAFIDVVGWGDAARDAIPGDASFRHYERLRLTDKKRAILMDAPPGVEDVRPFLHVDELLAARGCVVPEIFGRDVEQGFLLLEDFGTFSYSRVVREDAEREEELYHAAIDALVILGKTGPDASLPTYNKALLTREVSLFGEWLLPSLFPDEAKHKSLHSEYMALWDKAFDTMPLEPQVVVHRDYHADNLFWLDEKSGAEAVGMIDFQDAVSGRAAYDVVSLLKDVRRDVSPEVEASTLARYIEHSAIDEQSFMADYVFYGLQRNAKILGIFMRLYRRDGKDIYLGLMPRVWRLFKRDLQYPMFTEMKLWMDKHITAEMDRRVHSSRRDLRLW
jgi:aminoglycoside/choline kinase family phosphotransferase